MLTPSVADVSADEPAGGPSGVRYVRDVSPGDVGVRVSLRRRLAEGGLGDVLGVVEVWQDGDISVRVGFVQREDAASIRALLHEPASWRLRVTDRSDRVLVAALERARLENEASRDAESGFQEELALLHNRRALRDKKV